jgi:hypothetical protein
MKDLLPSDIKYISIKLTIYVNADYSEFAFSRNMRFI